MATEGDRLVMEGVQLGMRTLRYNLRNFLETSMYRLIFRPFQRGLGT